MLNGRTEKSRWRKEHRWREEETTKRENKILWRRMPVSVNHRMLYIETSELILLSIVSYVIKIILSLEP